MNYSKEEVKSAFKEQASLADYTGLLRNDFDRLDFGKYTRPNLQFNKELIGNKFDLYQEVPISKIDEALWNETLRIKGIESLKQYAEREGWL